ncbi:coiled-coil domain-containing protein 43-like [Oratosquilla oratoria]|uniref:coiled-coil domain-containing protein 43-like n=1 Tax=Oratosquilla oratoria TaxID=337810 RepID=UPI003F75D2E1
MAEAVHEFDVWLKNKLVGLGTDDEVFSPYITGILEGEENPEEKNEALQGIIAEITESGIEALCEEILNKWSLSHNNESKDTTPLVVAVDEKLAKIMGEQAQSVVTTKTRSHEEQKLREAILAQYSQVSDGEETDDEADTIVSSNTNADDVVKAERDKREKDKEEAQRKKEKDKEDRLKQKAKEDERKEKEKKRTQKGEKRR